MIHELEMHKSNKAMGVLFYRPLLGIKVKNMGTPSSILCVVLITIIFTYLIKSNKKSGSRLPPGPPKLPILGNLHQMVSKTTVPHRRLAELSKTYGRVMRLQLGEVPTIIVSSPDMARQVMKTHDAVFCNRPILTVAKEVFYDCTDIGLAPYGEYWRSVRKISTLELFTSKRVQSFRPIRIDEVTTLVNTLAASQGCVVDLSKLLFDYACDVMSRATFSTKRNEQGPFRKLLTSVTETCTGFCAADLYPSIKFLHTICGTKRRFQDIIQETNRIFDPIIEEHKSKKEDETTEHDLVDVLLKHHEDNVNRSSDFSLTNDNIKGVIMELLGGGSENSSSIVEWAMSELLRNPLEMEKAQAEVRRVYDEVDGEVEESRLEELKYMKLVIKETLRLHPPVPLLAPRESMERCEIFPYDIPTKTRVIINAYAIGRDSEYWPKPEIFSPERFEDSLIDYKGNNFELIPFGAGRRKCPGLALGIANVELPLAMLLYHFDWRLSPGVKPHDLDMEETFGLTMKRKNHLQVIPTLYSSSHLKS